MSRLNQSSIHEIFLMSPVCSGVMEQVPQFPFYHALDTCSEKVPRRRRLRTSCTMDFKLDLVEKYQPGVRARIDADHDFAAFFRTVVVFHPAAGGSISCEYAMTG
ncbi:TPA: hypothetical protein ACGIM3_002547 [Salmonella enterica subsp. enterica serovar Java]